MRRRPLIIMSLFVLCSTTALAQQRMGLSTGSTGSIPPGDHGSLRSKCLDEHGTPPLTTDRYTNLLTDNPRDITVKIGGKPPIPLQEAIRTGKVSITGITSLSEARANLGRATISRMRLNNLTNEPISVTVHRFTPIGTSSHRAFGYDVSFFERMSQQGGWREQQRIEAERKERQFRDNTKDFITKNSDHAVTLFNVYKEGDGYAIEFPDENITISSTESALLKEGKQLAPEHRLTARLRESPDTPLVMFKNRRMKRDPEYLQEADSLLFSVQKAYPDARIVREPFNATTKQRVTRLNTYTLESGDPLLFALDEKRSFSTTDWNTIQNIKAALKGRGFAEESFYDVKKGAQVERKGGKTVIVITGHIDAKLEHFIDTLGKAGMFRENLVILNACNQRPTRALTERICSEYDAVGVFSFQGDAEGAVNASEIGEYLIDLANQLKSEGKHNLVDILNRAIRKLGLNGIWTVFHRDIETDPQKGLA